MLRPTHLKKYSLSWILSSCTKVWKAPYRSRRRRNLRTQNCGFLLTCLSLTRCNNVTTIKLLASVRNSSQFAATLHVSFQVKFGASFHGHKNCNSLRLFAIIWKPPLSGHETCNSLRLAATHCDSLRLLAIIWKPGLKQMNGDIAT